MNELIRLIDGWRTRRVMVVGDYMLDRYLYGNAERLSPDAPVPVLAVQSEESRAGGSANVALCLHALRCDVTCVGIIGDDEAGRLLRRAIEHAGCKSDGLLKVDDRPTTVKQSLIGLAQHRHPQKMFRIDHEKRDPIDDATAGRVFAYIEQHLPDHDVLCIEDYNKGLLTAALAQRIIQLAKKLGKPVLIDPAPLTDYSKYRGATCITPNRTEAELATGLRSTEQVDQQVHDIARKLAADHAIDVIVLTLDRHGALLFERGGQPVHVPTVARNVYDVTGAGDMVLAALAGAVANGADWKLAVELANIAAGLEVEKFGIVPIPLDEVLVSALQMQHNGGKLRTLDELTVELAAHRATGKKIAFTNGCFDILHPGHIRLLRGARAQADMLVLAVNSDASIRAIKGEDRPILPEEDRIELLEALECIDYLILFGDGSGGEADTPQPLLRALKPDVLVKGGQYAHHEVVGWEIVESYGGKVVTIPHVEGRSTTNIVERIRGGK